MRHMEGDQGAKPRQSDQCDIWALQPLHQTHSVCRPKEHDEEPLPPGCLHCLSNTHPSLGCLFFEVRSSRFTEVQGKGRIRLTEVVQTSKIKMEASLWCCQAPWKDKSFYQETCVRGKLPSKFRKAGLGTMESRLEISMSFRSWISHLGVRLLGRHGVESGIWTTTKPHHYTSACGPSWSFCSNLWPSHQFASRTSLQPRRHDLFLGLRLTHVTLRTFWTRQPMANLSLCPNKYQYILINLE